MRILHLNRLSLPTEQRRNGFVSWTGQWPQQSLRTYHRQTDVLMLVEAARDWQSAEWVWP